MKCSVCKTHHTNISVCSLCKRTKYCSKSCQQADWIQHKQVCIGTHHDNDNDVTLYETSKNVLETVKRYNKLTWHILCAFLSDPSINTTVQRSNGNWTTSNLVYPPHLEYENEDGSMAKQDLFSELFSNWYLLTLTNKDDRQEALSRFPEMEFIWALPEQVLLKLYVTSLYDLIVRQMPPLTTTITVYRGYAPIADRMSPVRRLQDFKRGDEWVNWSFVSTSFDPNISVKFIERDCCLMKITIPSGMHAILVTTRTSDSSKYPTDGVAFRQAEVLLPPGLVYRFEEMEREQMSILLRDNKQTSVQVAQVKVIGIKEPAF